MVEEGKPAPDFELTSDAGERVKLSSLRGKPVVLLPLFQGWGGVSDLALPSRRRLALP